MLDDEDDEDEEDDDEDEPTFVTVRLLAGPKPPLGLEALTL